MRRAGSALAKCSLAAASASVNSLLNLLNLLKLLNLLNSYKMLLLYQLNCLLSLRYQLYQQN
jgi:hypothetical protein